jgi:phosphoglycolate phosphatase
MSAHLHSPSRFLVRAVLFDLDGTLADTAPDLGGALNRMRLRRGLPVLPIEVLRPLASAGARGMLAAGLDVTPAHAQYEAMRDEFLNEYAGALDQDTRLFDGVQGLLSSLAAMGVRWGVVTNKAMRFTEPVIAALGVADDAAVVVGGDTTAHAKPHPAPLLHACDQLGIAPTQAVYVGDDLRDMQAARSAGMPAIVAAYGYLGDGGDIAQWPSDGVIHAPQDLLELIAPMPQR